jgi:hypothetical protein
MKALKRCALVLALLVASTPLLADDLTGSDFFLCTAVQATVCLESGDCESGPPWILNIPQFIQVDLKNKKLSTTRASGENRSTQIKHLERDGGLIILQGAEGGRAFSFFITEETGLTSIAVAASGKSVAAFGACTPMSGPGK